MAGTLIKRLVWMHWSAKCGYNNKYMCVFVWTHHTSLESVQMRYRWWCTVTPWCQCCDTTVCWPHQVSGSGTCCLCPPHKESDGKREALQVCSSPSPVDRRLWTGTVESWRWNELSQTIKEGFTLRSSRLMIILYEEVVMFSFFKHRPDVPPEGLCGVGWYKKMWWYRKKTYLMNMLKH